MAGFQLYSWAERMFHDLSLGIDREFSAFDMSTDTGEFIDADERGRVIANMLNTGYSMSTSPDSVCFDSFDEKDCGIVIRDSGVLGEYELFFYNNKF